MCLAHGYKAARPVIGMEMLDLVGWFDYLHLSKQLWS